MQAHTRTHTCTNTHMHWYRHALRHKHNKSKEETHTICTRALRHIQLPHIYQETHSYIHGHTSRMHTARQSSKHTYMCVLSFLTLLVLLPNSARHVGGYSTLSMQPYLSKVCYSKKYVTLRCSFQKDNEYAGACQWKKTHGR